MIIDKTNIVLAAVLVALAGATFLTDRGSVFDETKTVSIDLFPGFDPANAARIEIVEMTKVVKDGAQVDEERKIELVRSGEVWGVASAMGYPAKLDKPKTLLEKVQGFKRGIVRSHNPDHHKALGVDATGKRCRIYDGGGKLLADVFIGRPAPDFRSTFIRKVDSDEVFVAPDNLAQAFATVPTQWYDNTVAPFPAEEAVGAELAHGDVRLTLEKDSEGTWKVTSPEEFVAEKRIAESLVRPIANLRFLSVAGKYEPGKYGLEQPSWRLSVKLGNGTVHTIRAGADTGDRGVFVQKEGSEFVFEASRPLIENLKKKVDDFRPKPPPEPKPAETPGATAPDAPKTDAPPPPPEGEKKPEK